MGVSVKDILKRLSERVAGVQAVILAGSDGVIDSVSCNPQVNTDAIAHEYGMLVRIASRVSEDTGVGELAECVVVAERSIVIARGVSAQSFILLVFTAPDQIGRARYELKKASWEIDGLA